MAADRSRRARAAKRRRRRRSSPHSPASPRRRRRARHPHLDYSLPYRTLLAGRGHTIPYLGDRVLARSSGCATGSTSSHSTGATAHREHADPARRRRTAAYVIDMETGARYPSPTDDQRRSTRHRHRERGDDLLDLQMGGRLTRATAVGRCRASSTVRATVDRGHRARRVSPADLRIEQRLSVSTNSATTRGGGVVASPWLPAPAHPRRRRAGTIPPAGS